MRGPSYVVAWAALVCMTAATSPTITSSTAASDSVALPAHSMVRKETITPHHHDGGLMSVEITGAALLNQDPSTSENVTAGTSAAVNVTSDAAGGLNDSVITFPGAPDGDVTTEDVVTAETPSHVDRDAGLSDDDRTEERVFAVAGATALNASEAAKTPEELANEKVVEDDVTREASGLPVSATATDPSIPPHLERPDLTYDYVDVRLLGTCDSHYEFQGTISNDECAKRCFETHGCTRFTNGGCSLGCRVSAPGKNVRNGVDVPLDGQCTIASDEAAGGCIVFELAFFNAVKQPSSCDADFKWITSATTKAQCAHACKNTAGCTSFSAEPNCMGGCRISEPAANAQRQCSLASDKGCTEYKVFR